MLSHINLLLSFQTLEALADAMQIYYNYTGESPCLDLQTEATPSLGVKGWNFQVDSFLYLFNSLSLSIHYRLVLKC